MITHYLKSSIKDIDKLIQTTIKDIYDIKRANHEKIFGRAKMKEEFLNSFDNKKSLLDNELVKLANNTNATNVEELLTNEQKELFEELKSKLTTLKSKNKEFAKLVLAVSEFYNSLVSRLFPQEEDGYKKISAKSASFLKVKA